MILSESGNIFKTPDGPITQRIATADVDTTVAFLEKITGYDWMSEKDADDDKPKNYLGTTGRKNAPDGTFEENSSGDLDLNTDLNKVSKEDITSKLVAWCRAQGIPDAEIMNKGAKKTNGWIKDAGDQVHFRTPIAGNAKNGFVQADFMFTDNSDFQIGSKRGGTAQYGGRYRAIVLSSIARGRGLKFSPKFGVVNPAQGDKVVATNWDDIAKMLLSPNATAADTKTVESMLAIIQKLPNYEELIGPARNALSKDGVELPEASMQESLADKQLSRLVALLGNF